MPIDMEIEISPCVTADSPDLDGDVCLNVKADHGESDVHFYLNKEQVEKILSLFD